MKRVQLTTVDHPRIEVECGGEVVSSRRIMNIDKNLNFDDNLTYIDVVN